MATPYRLSDLRSLPLSDREAAIRSADVPLLNTWACQLSRRWDLCVEFDEDGHSKAFPNSFHWHDFDDEKCEAPRRQDRRTPIGKTPLVIDACDSIPAAMGWAGEFVLRFEWFKIDTCGQRVEIISADGRRVHVDVLDVTKDDVSPSDIVRCVTLALECGE